MGCDGNEGCHPAGESLCRTAPASGGTRVGKGSRGTMAAEKDAFRQRHRCSGFLQPQSLVPYLSKIHINLNYSFFFALFFFLPLSFPFPQFFSWVYYVSLHLPSDKNMRVGISTFKT